jgi:catechol 2,3-dioxygenase-like lactoylglutathione lyase family enzyme
LKIKLTSVYVDDQKKALRFYTEVLGFVKKADFSQGPVRWLTVASPEEPEGTASSRGAPQAGTSASTSWSGSSRVSRMDRS